MNTETLAARMERLKRERNGMSKLVFDRAPKRRMALGDETYIGVVRGVGTEAGKLVVHVEPYQQPAVAKAA